MVELISAPQCSLVFIHRNQGEIADIYTRIYFLYLMVLVLTRQLKVSVSAHSGLSQVLVSVSVVSTAILRQPNSPNIFYSFQ